MTSALPDPDPGETADAWVRRVGDVFAVFDQQDSGCISYGVTHVGRRLFVKTAGTHAAAGSLRSALRFHRAVRHEAINPVLQCVTVAGSPVLVQPWLDGRLLYHSTVHGGPDRTDPRSTWAQFRALPRPRVEDAVDALLDAHRAVSGAGFVAVDLYDGSMMYDFNRHRLRLIDLDDYRPGPFVAHERLPGSPRFMAPEEYGGGTTVDERTTVHVLGRAVRLLLDAGDEESAWRGSDEQLTVVRTATATDPAHRFATVAELHHSWRVAIGAPRA